jgi:hypothetical protein
MISGYLARRRSSSCRACSLGSDPGIAAVVVLSGAAAQAQINPLATTTQTWREQSR